MTEEHTTHLFRLAGVLRAPGSITCLVSINDPPPGGIGCQRIVYDDINSMIHYEIPEAVFTPALRENEDMLKKILSICVKTAGPGEIDIPFVFPRKRETRTLPENAIEVFTDGSLSKSGTGGWAGLIRYSPGRVVEITGIEPLSTSNRIELLAVARTLDSIEGDGPVVVHTDSRYVIRGAEVWLPNWERNGFYTAQNRPVKNRDLWESLSAITKSRGVHFRWVPSSGGEPLHRRCDLLARAMSQCPLQSIQITGT
ncbi:MAG: ribonuclease HI [Spirochaetes bacterium]|nr:ribonuclease HI [Spirochaetota bacterium]